ncbi:MAG: GatB/YqeY domain-containing protein [Nitrospirae bacterium]|nr:GatB/YqeY domain-containing protein [Nitrospirota bacterium]
MTLSDRLSSDLKSALKSNDKARVSILRMIKAALKNKEIDKGGLLSDDEIISILNSFVKKGNESIEQFTKAGRSELADKEKQEVGIVKEYLPQQLSEDEISAVVKDVMNETGLKGAGSFGQVMKAVSAKTKGRADGKTVSAVVKKLLEEA